MASYTTQPGYMNQQIPIQYPYNNLISNNNQYNGYIGQNSSNFNNQFLKCRPVASKEEARAAQIDLDGSLWIFTDIGNQKIYTKQINNDGTANFKTYTLIKDEDPYSSPEYVTKEEFNGVIEKMMAAIQSVNNVPIEPVQNNEKKTSLANF